MVDEVKPAIAARIHKAFEVSILLKGAHAILECIAALALAIISTDRIVALVARFTHLEIAENPHDLVANHLMAWAKGLSVDTKAFFAWYLLSHGMIKLILVVALLRRKAWACPASLIVLGLFVVYQVYRYTYAPSAGLIVLTIFDVVVMVLIWHEFRLAGRVSKARERNDAFPQPEQVD